MTYLTSSPIFCAGYASPVFHHERSVLHSSFSLSQSFLHREVRIDPSLGDLAIPAHLHGGAFTSHRDCFVMRAGSLLSLSALICSPVFGLCTTGCFTFVRAKVTKSLMCILLEHLFLSSIQSSSATHSDANLPPPSHTHTHDCAKPYCASI